MTDLRTRLRALASFPADRPRFDPEHEPADAPATPTELFLAWLEDALAHGVLAPHAAVLSTSDTAGAVTARTLLVKDVDADAWLFATHRTSPKARDVASNPHAAMTFFWPTRARQVRVSGVVRELPPEVGTADFLARPDASRAATLVGHQSEPLATREALTEAFAASLDRVTADPTLADPGWGVYALDALRVEFWQAGDGATRWAYERPQPGAGWRAGLLWP